MMWYRGPNDWPTSSGPESARSLLGRRGVGAVGVIGVATVIASASESETAAIVSAPADESGGAAIVNASSDEWGAATAIVTSASDGPNRVRSSGEPVESGDGVWPGRVSVSSVAMGRPQ